MIWALYGEGPWPNADECIRQQTDECRVEFSFSLNGQEYRVIRARSSKGRGKTLLELAVKKGDAWQNITGDNITDTQAKIISLLRMEYRTLTSAAFILQGQADAFTRATPAEKKAILSQILELDQYDQLQALAKERARGYKDSIDLDKRECERLNAAISAETTINQMYDQTRAKRESHMAARMALDAVISGLQAEKENLVAAYALVKDAPAKIAAVQTEIDRLTRQANAQRERISKAQQIAGRADEVKAALAELEQVEGRLFEMDQDAAEAQQLERTVHYHETAASNLEHSLVRLKNDHANDIRLKEQRVRDLAARTKLLGEVNCERADCKFLIDALKARTALPEAEKALADAKALTPGQEVKATLEAAIADLQKARTALAAIGYNPHVHTDLKAKALRLRSYQTLKGQLEGAEQAITEASKAVVEIQESIDEKQAELTVLRSSGARAQDLNAAIGQRDREIAQKKQDLRTTSDSENALLAEIGRYQGQLATIETAKTQRGSLQTKIAEASVEYEHYNLLTTAFGRNGVPALIIENAIPEIERLANNLLSRMTVGAMNVSLITQRETRSTKDLSETLEVVIANSIGPRPYATWSGAERFMVDLSIRVAISQFLAHRAGTKIECLVIDEGVGALDPEGQQAFIDAVRVISQDFARVLVITHVEPVKDAFEQRIEVRKTEHGSRVEVIA